MDQSFSQLPDDMIKELCNKMTIKQLTAFIQTAIRQYNLCNPILQEKIIEEIQRKLALKAAIFSSLANLRPGQVLDASHMDNNGYGIRIIPRPGPQSTLMVISVYSIVVAPTRYNEIVDIMNTQPL